MNRLGTSALRELREIGLFGGLSDEEVMEFGGGLEVVSLDPGSWLFREGDAGRELFVLLEGEVEVLKRSKRGVDARVAVLGPGDWFGDMSIVDVQPRSASLRTVAPSRLVKMSAHDLDTLYRRDLKAYALVVLNIAREMSRRLRVMDGLMAELVANVVSEFQRKK